MPSTGPACTEGQIPASLLHSPLHCETNCCQPVLPAPRCTVRQIDAHPPASPLHLFCQHAPFTWALRAEQENSQRLSGLACQSAGGGAVRCHHLHHCSSVPTVRAAERLHYLSAACLYSGTQQVAIHNVWQVMWQVTICYVWQVTLWQVTMCDRWRRGK